MIVMNRKSIFQGLRLYAIYFTALYVWIGVSHYLYFNLNATTGNACFYGGCVILIAHVVQSDVWKKKPNFTK